MTWSALVEHFRIFTIPIRRRSPAWLIRVLRQDWPFTLTGLVEVSTSGSHTNIKGSCPTWGRETTRHRHTRRCSFTHTHQDHRDSLSHCSVARNIRTPLSLLSRHNSCRRLERDPGIRPVALAWAGREG